MKKNSQVVHENDTPAQAPDKPTIGDLLGETQAIFMAMPFGAAANFQNLAFTHTYDSTTGQYIPSRIDIYVSIERINDNLRRLADVLVEIGVDREKNENELQKYRNAIRALRNLSDLIGGKV